MVLFTFFASGPTSVAFPQFLPHCLFLDCFFQRSNFCFLTCIQDFQEHVRWSGIPISLKSFPQFVVIYTVKGFSIVNEAEVDAPLEVSCCFCDPADVGNLISGTSAYLKPSLNIWKFAVHVLLKPSLEILSIILLACKMSTIVR